MRWNIKGKSWDCRAGEEEMYKKERDEIIAYKWDFSFSFFFFLKLRNMLKRRKIHFIFPSPCSLRALCRRQQRQSPLRILCFIEKSSSSLRQWKAKWKTKTLFYEKKTCCCCWKKIFFSLSRSLHRCGLFRSNLTHNVTSQRVDSSLHTQDI